MSQETNKNKPTYHFHPNTPPQCAVPPWERQTGRQEALGWGLPSHWAGVCISRRPPPTTTTDAMPGGEVATVPPQQLVTQGHC